MGTALAKGEFLRVGTNAGSIPVSAARKPTVYRDRRHSLMDCVDIPLKKEIAKHPDSHGNGCGGTVHPVTMNPVENRGVLTRKDGPSAP